ncbi:MAG TPA: hypothetical protein DCR20_10925, partial [Planctomycetaceae bacterium]|nr:hypothetical protein [Planctomycetaceae bacterium]
MAFCCHQGGVTWGWSGFWQEIRAKAILVSARVKQIRPVKAPIFPKIPQGSQGPVVDRVKLWSDNLAANGNRVSGRRAKVLRMRCAGFYDFRSTARHDQCVHRVRATDAVCRLFIACSAARGSVCHGPALAYLRCDRGHSGR